MRITIEHEYNGEGCDMTLEREMRVYINHISDSSRMMRAESALKKIQQFIIEVPTPYMAGYIRHEILRIIRESK